MRNQRVLFYAHTNHVPSFSRHWNNWKSIAVSFIQKNANDNSNVNCVRKSSIVKRISSSIHLPNMRETIDSAVKNVVRVICWNLDWNGTKHRIKHTHVNCVRWHSRNGHYSWRTSKKYMQMSNWSVIFAIKCSTHDAVWKSIAKPM